MKKITVKVSADRECSLVPMQVKLDFADYLTAKDKEDFCPSRTRMVDKATGKIVPSQFSTDGNGGGFNGTLQWILLNQSQKEFEVQVAAIEPPLPSCFAEGVKIWDRGDGQLEVFLNGEHVTSYIFNEGYERPFLYPLIGPDGFPVTRSVPSLGDHPHHKGIGLALGDVSEEKGKPGIDFWGLGTIGDPKSGRVMHKRFTSLEQGPVLARIKEENVWKQNDELEGSGIANSQLEIRKQGAVLLNEKRTVTVWNVSPRRIIEIHTVMTPAVDGVILNADVERKETAKENGPLAIRVADSMRETAGGTIVNSEGARTERECWGRRARWVDYHGPVAPGGPMNGIAAMDHPDNLRHPVGWHVRAYGLFAVNPFYDKKPEWPDQGPVYLSKSRGDKLDLRYRIYVHRGDEKEGRVEEKWRDWVDPPRAVVE